MCVTCGCSDDAEATITHPETGQVVAMNSQRDNHHHSHTHTLPDGTVITLELAPRSKTGFLEYNCSYASYNIGVCGGISFFQGSPK